MFFDHGGDQVLKEKTQGKDFEFLQSSSDGEKAETLLLLGTLGSAKKA